jgi:hypothetical protein
MGTGEAQQGAINSAVSIDIGNGGRNVGGDTGSWGRIAETGELAFAHSTPFGVVPAPTRNSLQASVFSFQPDPVCSKASSFPSILF